MIQNNDDLTEYVRKQVALGDPDRYLTTLFAPRASLPSLWAILLFNQEIAKTRDVVTETTIGLIRLQWWRDALGRDGMTDDHPALLLLRPALESGRLEKEALEELIYAREFDLEDTAPANLQGLENYADFTTTPLLRLMVQACGVDVDQDRLRFLGVAYGLTGILRAVRAHGAHRRCYLPQDMMQAADITTDQVFAGQNLDRLVPLTKDIALYAQDHLCRASEIGHVPVLRALGAIVDLYLRQIEQCGYDVFSPELSRPPKFRELRVAWRVMVSGRLRV